LRERIERALQQLAADPFQPTLHSHKLKGQLADAWACTVDYENRTLFEFVRIPETGEDRSGGWAGVTPPKKPGIVSGLS